jgi:lipopolysaccharide transport system ATP-binding protein
MADTVLDVQEVSKKFLKGELYTSLRDLVPAATRRMLRRGRPPEVDRREFWALRDVSFSVRRGEAFGIIGGNGAGKSTMLKLLSGIMRPTMGAIQVTGRLSALIEVSAGFHHDLTGRENIFLNGAILGMTRAEIRQRYDAIIAFSGLEEFIDTPVKRYSSGMFARLGFSVAAHVDPDVLLVDEVLSVGDYLFQRKCMERMHTVIGSGATVIFVSHNLREVANLCQRSLLLERGQVRAIGPTADVIREYYQRGEERHTTNAESPSVITQVTVHDEAGPSVEFASGGTCRVTVEAHARRRTTDMSVEIRVVDQNQYAVFDTGTQRLGRDPITLERGQTISCTFELQLELLSGTYHVNAYLHRYVTDRDYDAWLGAGTFFIKGVPEARGIAWLQPRLAECRVDGSGDP